jgi:hypothetical protein
MAKVVSANTKLVIFKGIHFIFSNELCQSKVMRSKLLFQSKEKTYLDILKQLIKTHQNNQETIKSFGLSPEEVDQLVTNPYILKNFQKDDYKRFSIR